jgi:hypothetical protein
MKIGRLPYSYPGVRQTLQRAADAAGIGKLTTHAFRHSFRTWLNQTGAPIATQQRLMRHSDHKGIPAQHDLKTKLGRNIVVLPDHSASREADLHVEVRVPASQWLTIPKWMAIGPFIGTEWPVIEEKGTGRTDK